MNHRIGWGAHNAFRHVVLVVAVLSLVGCSLVNPHVRWERPQGTALSDAITYANAAKDRYKEAVGNQASLTNGLALGLIPLGASALGLGMTGGSSVAITALGLTGATGFASGNWLSSRPRQLIYIEGSAAISCAVDAVRPLGMDSGTLAGAVNGLHQTIGDVELQIETVRGFIDQVRRLNQDPRVPVEAARTDIEAAEKALTDARQTLAAGVRFQQEAGQAGQALISAVDRIGNEVDRALVSTQPDLQMLPAVIASLSQLSRQFGPVPTPKAADAPAPIEKQSAGLPGEQELIDARATLRQKVVRMGQRAVYLAALLKPVADAKPLTSLQHCKVAEVATGFTIAPSSLDFKEGSEVTKSFFVTGGKPPYAAEPVEQPMEGFTLPHALWWGQRIDVVAKKPSGGPYTIRVTDNTGQSQSVTLTVVKAGAGGDGAKPKAATLTEEEKKTIQSVLCVSPPDAWDGQRTKDAIDIYQKTVAGAATGTIDEAQKAALLKTPPCPEGLKNFYERELTDKNKTRIEAMQEKLRVAKTGKLDEKTREAITSFKKKNNLKPEDDQLRSSGEVDDIIKSAGL